MAGIGRRAFLAALGTAWLLGAADDRDRESLRDLDGVRIAVEDAPPVLAIRGLSSEDLKNAASAKLQQAGIRVLNQGEYPVGDPYLRVQLTVIKGDKDFTVYNVQVDFVQIVFLRRNPSVTFNRAETWKAKTRMGVVPTGKLPEAILEELSGQMDQFISAYRSVNP